MSEMYYSIRESTGTKGCSQRKHTHDEWLSCKKKSCYSNSIGEISSLPRASTAVVVVFVAADFISA